MEQVAVAVSRLCLVASLLASARAARADSTFEETFENGSLGQWFGKLGGPHTGVIVTDPLNPANHVLTFSSVTLGGDVFTSALIDLGAVTAPRLSFDYLGRAKSGSVPDDLGGFIGISKILNPVLSGQDGTLHFWIAGTAQGYGSSYGPGFETRHLVDDGTWHHIEVDLTAFVTVKGMDKVHILAEDFVTSGPVTGDVFFDNIRVTGSPTPESASWISVGLALALGAAYRSRAKSSGQGTCGGAG